MKKGPALLATVSALMITPGVFAEQPFELDPSIITATGMRESLLLSPASITRLDRYDIERTPVADAAELFRDIPGVTLEDSNTPGMKRISIRGESSRRVAIKIDGQTMTDHSTYGTPLLIDPAMIERIEVIRGPSSVINGSNAIGGVVNIITRGGGEKPLEAHAGAGYYSATQGYRSSAGLDGSANGFDYRLALSRSEHADRRTPDGTLDYSDYDSESVSAHLGYRWANQQLALKAEQFNLSANAWRDPALGVPLILEFPERDQTRYAFFYQAEAVTDWLIRTGARHPARRRPRRQQRLLRRGDPDRRRRRPQRAGGQQRRRRGARGGRGGHAVGGSARLAARQAADRSRAVGRMGCTARRREHRRPSARADRGGPGSAARARAGPRGDRDPQMKHAAQPSVSRALVASVGRALARSPVMLAGSSGIVAFSGGPDSLCLLGVLAELAGVCGWSALRAVHVDHGLRAASAAEAQQAQSLAQQLGVPCEVVRLSSRPARENLQQWARQQRMAALVAAARATSSSWIATGHTADDQAETVLMRIVRGTGTAGLGAMALARPLEGGLWLLRPLLDARRWQVGAWLAGSNLCPVSDPSNASPAYLRNRLRAGVLPQLERDNPAVVAALCRLAATCREEHEALAAVATDAWCRSRHREQGLDVAALGRLPAGLLHRVLRREVEAVAGPQRARTLARQHLLDLASLALGPPAGTRRLSLPGVVASRCYDRLVVEPAARAVPPAGFVPLVVNRTGVHELSDGRRLLVARVPSVAEAGPLLVATARARFPLLVRPCRRGDRLTIGVGRRKKIARVLIDAKVPAGNRAAVPLVESGGQVVLVVGVRRQHGAAPAVGQAALSIDLA
ncbi:MAG: tRNA lysidine(34) synthetase TilS [Halopseudomonas sp.]